jgi:inositol transport system permease protein
VEQGWLDLPVVVPILVALGCGLGAGLVNGLLIAYTNIPPFIATLGMMVAARGAARWWSHGNPISFPTDSYTAIANGNLVGQLTGGLINGQGLNPVLIFMAVALLFHLALKYTLYGKHTYAIGSNREAARVSGIDVKRHLVLVYTIAGVLAGLAALLLTSKNLTAQAGMGVMYELDAIAMAVIGGISLAGGRGSIIGTVLGALIFGVILSGFTFLKIDAYYQEMLKGVIIVSAVIADQWRQKRRARES